MPKEAPRRAVRSCALDWTDVASQKQSRLMALPAEVRIKIWTRFFSHVARPRLRYAVDFEWALDTDSHFDIAWLYASKRLYLDAWPVFLAQVRLDVVYIGHSPTQLAVLPPPILRRELREICFHCPVSVMEERPPRRPFPFHRYPRLRNFHIASNILVLLDRFRCKDSNGPMTVDMYRALSPPERLAAWKDAGLPSVDEIIEHMTSMGKGGWLSRVVDPKTFTRPLVLTQDSSDDDDDDGEDGNEEWQGWTEPQYSEDEQEEKGLFYRARRSAEWLEAKEARDLEAFRKVAKQMHTLVEAELTLFERNVYPMPDDTLDTLFVLVDTRTRKIMEMRMLDAEEIEERARWAAQA
ncbi:uncharacterized protein F5Z01DRAFT_663987 [Emericellopsis atlantica]|uniref:Uncharacterized protein n=1 Tax=Emericellopsis atlantica TaxID=2614577 RepID=A0A9P8CKZ5_9HYPO|nr:uncharacterized protein F5Z01DRAFT_663987 [Emericellopsis atlantica]KAG9251099.1 hypothetical protein F5Z01DRAFT_663987 [Emericellopsis atlantica]